MNIVTVCFAVVVLVFYTFPTVMPVTGNNMSELIPRFLVQTADVAVTRLFIRSPGRDGYFLWLELASSCEETLSWAATSTCE